MKQINDWWVCDDEEDDGYLRFSKKKGDWQNNLGRRAVFSSRNNRTAIDIGSCYGAMSNIFAQDFETVHAFEIMPDFMPCLKKNNEEHDNIVYHNVGLSSKEHKVVIKRKQYGGRSLIFDSSFTGGLVKKQLRSLSEKVVSLYEVEVKPLDAFELEYVDLIKIDVENFEPAVVWGAMETIKKWKPLLVIEMYMAEQKAIVDFLLTEVLDYRIIYKQKKDFFYEWQGQ